MPLFVHLFPCLSDNYGFLARDEATGAIACIDTPEAEPILRELQSFSGGRLDLILNTHWHPDHTQGNAAVKAATGAEIIGPEEVRKAAPVDRVIAAGDTVRLGDTTFEVIATPGHTLGHIAFIDRAGRTAFVGDTLFPMGCGRLFEGTPAQMWDSLSALMTLDDHTVLYGAHEYTAANARFAVSIDHDPATAARARAVFAARERGEPTVPTTLAEEKRTNPMLRAPLLGPSLGADPADPAACFAAVRAAKDEFKG